MNHAGEYALDGFSIEVARYGSDYRSRTLAIVGSHPKGLDGIPWDDLSLEVLLMNEAPLKPEKYPRWDMALQIHLPEVYSSPFNWVNSGYWDWLQQKRGKPIWMQEVDVRVPDSVKYPLDEILAMIPYRYLRSSPAMCLALGIYLGYGTIYMWGSELTSNTEYTYQATNLAFWIGFAHGRGVDLKLRCWQDEFDQLIYGYEGELQLGKDFFVDRQAELQSTWENNEKAMLNIRNKMETEMMESKFDKVGETSINLENAAMAAGELSGILREISMYADRDVPISRQEFERRAAQAQQDGDKIRTQKDMAAGRCEYAWNVWRQSGKLDALQQLRKFLREKTDLAYEIGVKYGTYRENISLMAEYDKRLNAAGGVRALGDPSKYALLHRPELAGVGQQAG